MERFAEERSGGAQYLAAVRERWLLIVSIVVVAVGAAVLLSAFAEKRYEANADVLVTPIEAGDETFIGINLLREGSQSRSVLTAAHLVATPQVAERAKEALGFDGTAEQLLERVDVQPQEQSNILTIVGKAPTADGAAEIANAFAESLIELRTETFQDELDSVRERLDARLDAIPARPGLPRGRRPVPAARRARRPRRRERPDAADDERGDPACRARLAAPRALDRGRAARGAARRHRCRRCARAREPARQGRGRAAARAAPPDPRPRPPDGEEDRP